MIASIPTAGRWCLAGAGAVALGIALPPAVLPVVVAATLWMFSHSDRSLAGPVLGVLVLLGWLSGMAADARTEPVFPGTPPEGVHRVEMALAEDARPGSGWMAVGSPISIDDRPWAGPRLAVGPLVGAVAGDRVLVDGRMTAGIRHVGSDVVAGTLRVSDVVDRSPTRSPLFVVANAVRGRVRSSFGSGSPADALMRGLLIGDTDGLAARDMEDLRRAGLAHFVAVSGSNVALFLGVWWLIGFPLAARRRARALFGFMGIAVFVVVTRWEPSVLRASAMASVPLVGGLVGVPVDPWMALGVAVGVLLLVSADLLTSVGFLLSVLATAGVLLGTAAVRDRRPRLLWTALGATVGAQVAVAPILLVVFGSIPLVAPIANLAAAPVVAVTTVVGMVVIIAPLPLLTSIAGIGATVILDIARRTSEGPQLGVIASVAMGVVVLAIISRWTRPLGLAALCCVALFVAAGQPSWPTSPTAVVLDVGQGDAILLQDPSGLAMLVDGGREPAILDRALRRHGVRSLAVVVVTHADADHVGGLVEVVEGLDVGEVWIGADATTAALLDDVLDAAARRDIPVVEVREGLRGTLGDIALEVVGPRRRYLGDNDGSVVILAAARRSILLAGDIEAVAQRELAPVAPDVLLVPHHGSATSDLDWLERTLDEVAILSYGPNTYGHPAPAVVDVLAASGVEIHRTATDGDITIDLG